MKSSATSFSKAFATILIFTSLATLSEAASNATTSVAATCNKIAQAISSDSDVYFPGSVQYSNDIAHFANSSTEVSVCSVEPGTADDVGIILQILGETNTTFAVKGGGHTFNQGFSSTTGVQISLTRFVQINVNEAQGTVELGTGLVWDDVYEALGPLNYTVAGGRVTGVGVAGFILGGGLSFKTNEYGIGAANVVEFELVLPNGQILTVNATSNPDLFFAVRGTQNNYGIVTSITMTLLEQGLVWGGTNIYPVNSSTIPAIVSAIDNFANNVQDTKAAAVLAFDYQNGETTLDTILYYNGATPPPGIFDQFLALPAIVSDASTQSFEAIVASSNGNDTIGDRASLDHTMVQKWNPTIISAVINETMFWGERALQIDPNAQILYPLEVFLPSMFQHGNPGAWPPNGTASRALQPQAIQWSWTTSPSTDSWFINAQKASSANMLEVLASQGESTDLPLYPNYAISGTPVLKLFGQQNLLRLEQIKEEYDPENVMGLAGGWKIPV